MTLRFGSVCSGIEAASVAWEPLGWLPQFYSEIEPFPCAVLHEHWSSGRPRFMPDPDEPGLSDKDSKARRAAIKSVSRLPERANGVPNFGDMTQFEEWPDAVIDVLVGGTPCQSYSVAGLRKGLDDPRGDLMLTYVAIARRYRPRWVVWENVFGVLSSNGGRDFASLLGLLSGRRIEVPAGGWRSSGIVEGYERAYGLSWRVFDTQFVRVDGAPRALPQRRRRVFVVGHIGADWRRAAAVLLERHGLSGHPAPSREAGEGFARDVAPSLRAQSNCSLRDDSEAYVATFDRQSNCEYGDADLASTVSARDYKSPTDLVAIGVTGEISHTLKAEGADVLAFNENQQGVVWESDTAQALNKGGGKPGQGYAAVRISSAVRRLTPTECARLQGFDDNHCRIPWRGKPADQCPDGPQYKAFGNSMSTNVMRWIGERIQFVDQIKRAAA